MGCKVSVTNIMRKTAFHTDSMDAALHYDSISFQKDTYTWDASTILSWNSFLTISLFSTRCLYSSAKWKKRNNERWSRSIHLFFVKGNISFNLTNNSTLHIFQDYFELKEYCTLYLLFSLCSQTTTSKNWTVSYHSKMTHSKFTIVHFTVVCLQLLPGLWKTPRFDKFQLISMRTASLA